MAHLFRHFSQVIVVAGLSLFLSSCDLLEGPIEQNVLNWAIANYTSACACPFSLNALGEICGDQSAYSLGIAEAPICYVSEVTVDLIAQYLAST